MDKILIRGLSIDAIVGIYPYEREHEQPLLLDLTLELPLKECAQSGDLSKSINYADVCLKVTDFVRQQKALLVEGQEIAMGDFFPVVGPGGKFLETRDEKAVVFHVAIISQGKTSQLPADSQS